MPLARFSKLIFYNETSPLLQKNVVLVCKMSLLLLVIILHNAYHGNVLLVIFDVVLIVLALIQWFTIAKYKAYFVFPMFIIFLPLLTWEEYIAVIKFGEAGTLWAFPITLLLYFCFPSKLAWVSSLWLMLFTLVFSWLTLSVDFTVRLLIALTMVIMTCGVVFNRLNQQNQLLKKQAQRDALTGLFNRTLLQSTLRKSIYTLPDNHHSPAVLWIDVDHFKSVNDNFGHQMGDTVLVQLAHVFQDQLNRPDKVFRLGGEEFLILLHNQPVANVKIIAQALCDRVFDLTLLPENKRLTISIGVAAYQPPEDWNDWLKRADHAMYTAKEQGRNRVVLATT